MIELSALSVFISTSFILAITPGPDILFVVNQSILYGVRAGLTITLGLCAGLLVHASLVAFGIASLIQQSPILFISLQLVGALYLLYLAKRLFVAPPLNIQTAAVASSRSNVRLYLRGFIMNVTNPKVTLFFLAFLPQFIDPAADTKQQISLLGLTFIIVTFVVFGSVALLAHHLLTNISESARWQKRLNLFTALTFASLSGYILYGLFG